MRKLLIPIVAGVSAVSLSVPAAAQWAPPVYHYQPYSYTRTFSNVRFAQSMQVRVQRIRADIRAMDARNILGARERTAKVVDDHHRFRLQRFDAGRHQAGDGGHGAWRQLALVPQFQND